MEHDDVRAILDRAVEAGDAAVAIGVAFDMWRFWQKHGHLAEARRRLTAMAATDWSRSDPRLRAKLVEALGGTCWWQGDLPAMGGWYDEALAIWREQDDPSELANAYYNASFAYALSDTNTDGAVVPDPDRIGIGLLERARDLYHEIGDQRGEANATWGIGNYEYFHQVPGHGVEQFRDLAGDVPGRG